MLDGGAGQFGVYSMLHIANGTLCVSHSFRSLVHWRGQFLWFNYV